MRRTEVAATRGASAMPRSARRPSALVQARFASATTASTANMPVIPPPAASTITIAAVAAVPVASPTIDASRQRCAPISTAEGTVCRTLATAATAASIHADFGSAPARAAAPSTPPARTAPTAWNRQPQETRSRSSPARPRPRSSPTKRISESESPIESRLTSEISANAMKLWTPIPLGPRNRAATIDWTSA